MVKLHLSIINENKIDKLFFKMVKFLENNPYMDLKVLKPYVQFQFDYAALEKGIQNRDKTEKTLNSEVFDNELGKDESK